jgi:hypothetical protein
LKEKPFSFSCSGFLMTSSTTLVLAFLFGSSAPPVGDASCDRIKERERHAYCHCVTSQGGKADDVPASGRSAYSREPSARAAIMSCMERRGFGV